MEINHRVAFNGDTKPTYTTRIEQLGVKYRNSPLFGGKVGLVYFDIAESDRNWPVVAELIRVWGLSDFFGTRFDPQEILAADWARLVPTFEQGFAQPEDEPGWKSVTYDNACLSCGAGYVQKAPFRFAKEPRLGKRDFVSLFGTYAVFCTSNVIAGLVTGEVRGYEVWEALLHRTSMPSRIVSQLVFPTVTAPILADEDKAHPETCARCGITKYASHLRGYMHVKRHSLPPGLDVVVTYEWFGSGAPLGFREILISNRLSRLILERGWRGVALKPVTLV